MTDAVAAVEAVAPDANASPEVVKQPDGEQTKQGSEAAPSPAVTDTDEIANKAKGVGKRIDELTRNWREAERREQALLEILRQRAEPAKAQPDVKASTPKTLADFDYDEGRFAAHLSEQATSKAIEAARRELVQEREREQAERRRASFQTRETDFAKTVDDYFETTRDQRVPISEPMAEAIADSDDGPALAYHLAKNIEVAARIAQLSPLAAARELGRIEAKLATEREKAKEKPRVSTAPPPPPKVDAVEPAVSIRPDTPESDTLSADEWFAKREKQLSKRRE